MGKTEPNFFFCSKKAQKCYCESISCRGYIGSSESGREILTDGSKIPKSKKATKKKITEDEEIVATDEEEEVDEENVDKSDEEDDDKEEFLEDIAVNIIIIINFCSFYDHLFFN